MYPKYSKVSLLTVDYDDESAAQMLFIQKLLKKYEADSVIENISEMWLTYSVDKYEDEGCTPVVRLFDRDTECLINAYPKEWLINEIERDELVKYDIAEIRSFEPFWKLILGNKALLPLLWSMFPNHPNLLPAYYDKPYDTETDPDRKWVSKPLYGREGIGVLRS